MGDDSQVGSMQVASSETPSEGSWWGSARRRIEKVPTVLRMWHQVGSEDVEKLPTEPPPEAVTRVFAKVGKALRI